MHNEPERYFYSSCETGLLERGSNPGQLVLNLGRCSSRGFQGLLKLCKCGQLEAKYLLKRGKE
jgi:hypothetical protein